jgi:NADH:ubiquinone oxidoreductase subunit 2 (subunit N)
MRRLFLKHPLEYLSLVNSGYLILCLTPLTLKSLNYCIIFLSFYILVIFFYGGIVLFFDNQEFPGKRVSFDFILSDIKKKDIHTVILSNFFFFFLGFPPTRRDYPCSRGIPFNGCILQWLVLQSLLIGQSYLFFFLLIIFNLIVVFFFLCTVIPFWHKNKHQIFWCYPEYLTLELIEFVIFYFFFSLN